MFAKRPCRVWASRATSHEFSSSCHISWRRIVGATTATNVATRMRGWPSHESAWRFFSGGAAATGIAEAHTSLAAGDVRILCGPRHPRLALPQRTCLLRLRGPVEVHFFVVLVLGVHRP